MTLGDFRKFTEHLPDNTKLIIYNDCSEWYGEEEMNKKAWNIERKNDQYKLIFDFSNC